MKRHDPTASSRIQALFSTGKVIRHRRQRKLLFERYESRVLLAPLFAKFDFDNSQISPDPGPSGWTHLLYGNFARAGIVDPSGIGVIFTAPAGSGISGAPANFTTTT